MAKATPELGPLAKVISKPKFEDGKLVRCAIVKDANHLAGDSKWATVRELYAGQYTPADYAKVYLDPVMTALRIVRLDASDNIIKLCTGKRTRPFEELVIDWLRTPAEAVALVNATALPALKRLRLRYAADRAVVEQMIGTVVAAKLDRLTIDIPMTLTDLGAVVAKARMQELVLEDEQHLGATWVFQRGAAGLLSRLSVTFEFPEKSRRYMGAWTGPDWPEAIFNRLETLLGSLPKGSLTELSLVARPQLKKKVNKARLAAIAKRFGA